MFLVASVECLIPVCLCIGEVVPAQGPRYLATSPAAAEFRVIDISQPLLLPVPIHSQISRILPIRLLLRLRLRLHLLLLILIRLRWAPRNCCIRVFPRFRDFEVG